MIVMYILSMLTSLSGVAPAVLSPKCKPVPNQQGWPSDSQWQTLNTTVSGRLSMPAPPGAVCHPDQPAFNNATCATVFAQWPNSSFHALNPWSTDYNDDACLPSAEAPCIIQGYPAYAIEAINAADVQAGVRFAHDTGVRLIVKATGHDWPGRSKGPNSLEIWTHLLRGVDITMEDPRAVACGGVGSMKIAAGMRWEEIYVEAAKHNVTVVGGASLSVGIGGWILNGGHSPVSSLYGLGADQVLEMEVVTADGQLLTINETTNTDLFWAMRGGGGSTYAVLLSVTVKVYPSLAGSAYLFAYNTTSDNFWPLLAYFHSQLPGLSEAGAMGYYYASPQNDHPDPKQASIIYGVFLFPRKTKEQAAAIMNPFEDAMNTSAWSKDRVYKSGLASEYEDFISAWSLLSSPEQVGGDGRLGSWLLDGKALTEDFKTLEAQLQKASTGFYIGHLIAGPGVRNAIIPGGSNAVLPAWRKAYTHLVLPVNWTPFNVSGKALATKRLREVSVPALKALAPDSGAYINEADPTQPDWQKAFYGENYDRLLKIKQQYDPNGVFWCKPCVGNELWEVVDGSQDEDKVEWGIGQSAGIICKTKK